MKKSNIKKSEISKSEIASKEIKKSEIASKEISKNLESLFIDSPKRSKKNSPSIYKIDSEIWGMMEDKERKSFRSKKRRELQNFINAILGRDRNDDERLLSIKEFKKYFKENYISSSLDSSALYSGNDENKRKDINNMIIIIKEFKKS